MNSHGVDGDRHAGVKQSADGRANLRFEGDLTEPVIGTVAGGFRVEEDEHGEIITVFG